MAASTETVEGGGMEKELVGFTLEECLRLDEAERPDV